MINFKVGQRGAGLSTSIGGGIFLLMAKQTPLLEIHRRNGAELVEANGWILPAHFGAPLEEYEAVRCAVGLLDMCDHAALRISGPDRVSYLQGMVSNDVKKLSSGSGVYAAVLDVNGKILADLRVLCAEDSFILLVWEPLKDKVIAQLNRYLVADDVEIRDEAAAHGMLSIQGPHALLLLSAIAPRQDPPVHMHSHSVLRVGDNAVRAVRATHTGEEGFDLLVETQNIARVVEELNRAGAALSLRWTGLQAQEILRVEAGIPRYGIDMDENNLLLETGLDQAVSFQKGCYIGQEVIERVRSRGHVNRKLAGVVLGGKSPAHRGDKITFNGKEIGKITSSVFSPRLHHAVAMGYVQRDYLQPGMSVTVEVDGGQSAATLSALPFVYETSP
jgi:glycine cleavage system T protein